MRIFTFAKNLGLTLCFAFSLQARAEIPTKCLAYSLNSGSDMYECHMGLRACTTQNQNQVNSKVDVFTRQACARYVNTLNFVTNNPECLAGTFMYTEEHMKRQHTHSVEMYNRDVELARSASCL